MTSEQTIADAIPDRIVQNTHHKELARESLRRRERNIISKYVESEYTDLILCYANQKQGKIDPKKGLCAGMFSLMLVRPLEMRRPAKEIHYFNNIFPKTVVFFKKMDTFATLLKEAKSLETTKVIGV